MVSRNKFGICPFRNSLLESFTPPDFSNKISSISNDMTAIHVEKNPAEQRLQELGVRSWAIWTKDVSSFLWHYDEQETCYFLEGSVVVTPANGNPVQISKGDLFTFPEGMDCGWEIKESVRKDYIF
jgi:uncharacterized cupin superfamily protein